jgi:hypothetical protein
VVLKVQELVGMRMTSIFWVQKNSLNNTALAVTTQLGGPVTAADLAVDAFAEVLSTVACKK